MKIVQINSVCGYGSTGKIAVDIANSAKNKGHECIIAYGRRDANMYPDAIKIGNDNNVRVHGVMSRLTDKHGLFSKKATKIFVEQLREIKPDIVHLHNIHGYYLHYPTLFQYLKETQAKVVWTLHDCWSFTGHCAYYTYAQCNKFQKQCSNCPQKNEYPKAFVDASKSNFENKKACFSGLENLVIVTPSKWLEAEVKKSFLAEYTTKVVNNGIDLSKFKKVEISRKSNKKIILGVASVWDRRKGLDTFLQLAEVLPEEYEIVLVGLNDKQIAALPNNIKGIKKTDSIEELVEYYNEAVVFLNPTQEDNYPTTNLEAQACGTPVITFDVGGAKETLKSSFSIAVKPTVSINDLLEVIKQMEGKRGEINMQEICKQFAAEEYLEIYKNIIKGADR